MESGPLHFPQQLLVNKTSICTGASVAGQCRCMESLIFQSTCNVDRWTGVFAQLHVLTPQEKTQAASACNSRDFRNYMPLWPKTNASFCRPKSISSSVLVLTFVLPTTMASLLTWLSFIFKVPSAVATVFPCSRKLT